MILEIRNGMSRREGRCEGVVIRVYCYLTGSPGPVIAVSPQLGSRYTWGNLRWQPERALRCAICRAAGDFSRGFVTLCYPGTGPNPGITFSGFVRSQRLAFLGMGSLCRGVWSLCRGVALRPRRRRKSGA